MNNLSPFAEQIKKEVEHHIGTTIEQDEPIFQYILSNQISNNLFLEELNSSHKKRLALIEETYDAIYQNVDNSLIDVKKRFKETLNKSIQDEAGLNRKQLLIDISKRGTQNAYEIKTIQDNFLAQFKLYTDSKNKSYEGKLNLTFLILLLNSLAIIFLAFVMLYVN